MNAMDRIHHFEHRRPSRGSAPLERACAVAAGSDPSVTAPEPDTGTSALVSAEDFSD